MTKISSFDFSGIIIESGGDSLQTAAECVIYALEDGTVGIGFDPLVPEEDVVSISPADAGGAYLFMDIQAEVARCVYGEPSGSHVYYGGAVRYPSWEYGNRRVRLMPVDGRFDGIVAVMAGTCKSGHVGVIDASTVAGFIAAMNLAISYCGGAL